jgi:hypothetical protein
VRQWMPVQSLHVQALQLLTANPLRRARHRPRAVPRFGEAGGQNFRVIGQRVHTVPECPHGWKAVVAGSGGKQTLARLP